MGAQLDRCITAWLTITKRSFTLNRASEFFAILTEANTIHWLERSKLVGAPYSSTSKKLKQLLAAWQSQSVEALTQEECASDVEQEDDSSSPCSADEEER